jgi:hypothetical protein
MNGRHRALLAGVLLFLAAMAAWAMRGSPAVPPRPPEARPPLLLLTSLPLIFGEKFALGGGGSPALTRLRERYRVEPIALADSRSLGRHRLLLMAHPRAQTAEALVALDAWVRSGGRLLLLADPRLEWPSERPLGDPLRPPPGFADTGLLTHWGLTLSPPATRGPDEERIDGRPVRFISPGTLSGTGFTILAGGRAARGTVGRGRVMVIADADWLRDPTDLDPLVAELARLEG